MATEIELKLELPSQAAKQLAAHPLLASIPLRKLRLLNTYYDTPALDLHARRIALRFRKKNDRWLLTVKSAEPASGGLSVRSEWETEAAPGVFDFSHVDQAELNSFLSSSVDELHAVFSTDFQRTVWQVPFGESLIELAVDRGSIASRGQKLPICEVELELLSGRIDDIFGLTATLQDDFNLRPALESKAERGYRLFTGEPPRPRHATLPSISANLAPIEAFRRIALSCLEHFQRNEKGVLETDDPEYIHQARVALRRLRSALKLFSPILPADFVATYDQGWKKLANMLGEVRNWEVFLTETLPPIEASFPKHPGILRLRAKGTQQLKRARRALLALLRHADCGRLLLRFTSALYALDDTTTTGLKSFAEQRLSSRAKSVRRLMKPCTSPAPAKYHQLRIRIKKMRYALEFLAPLLPEKGKKSRLAHLAFLQNALGKINDLATAEVLITDILGDQTGGPARGWIAGRHALLCEQMPQLLADWQRAHREKHAAFLA